MTASDYRAQALAVRAAARRTLLEFRQQRRRAARGPALTPDETAEAASDEALIAAPGCHAATVDAPLCDHAPVADAPVEADPSGPVASSPDDAQGEGASSPAPESAGITVSASVAAFARGAAAAQEPLAPLDDAMAVETAPDQPAAPEAETPEADALDRQVAEAAPEPEAHADSPGPVAPAVEDAGAPATLDALPGVGPGLVWLLNRAGVHTAADLAAADPAALSDRLGLVGRLIDVRTLQALARPGA
jgi:predicted flap endonuclease-1-like 5' DNA nuclease